MSRSKSLKSTPTVEFGTGAINNLPGYLPSPYCSTLIVSGACSLHESGKKETIELLVADRSSQLFWEEVDHEPSPMLIDSIVSSYVEQNIGLVIAIGGGSAIDAGKAVSAMLPSGKPVIRYLEDVGTETPTGEKVPFIAIPTTSGTGSEATSNSVITQSGRQGFKKSLRHDNYIPDVALIDPLLILSCPPEITASCGMDTFSQLVEAYLSTESWPETDAISLKGIQSVHRGLARAYENGEDITARSRMALASFFSGIVLMNAGLGAVHGLAPALGSFFPIPHGVACGTLMATANDITLRKIREENNDTKTLAKYTTLGRLVSDKSGRSDDYYQSSFIAYLYELTEELKLPQLSRFDVKTADLGKIGAAAANKNNPVPLTKEDFEEIVAARI